MADEVVDAIGHLPEGKGLLGPLVDYPQSLRLAEIAEHVASVGFPDRHPPMHSFLGVPIRVADRVFGNLNLTEKQGAAEFTPDDEELVRALAAAAAVAIENATLLTESRRRQVWQTAVMEITTRLLAEDDPDEALRHLIRRAGEALGAVGAGVNVPTDDPLTWRVAVTQGVYTRWQDAEVPLQDSATGAAVAADDLVLIADRATDPRTEVTGAQRAAGLLGDTLAVPVRTERGVSGVLVASRRPGEAGFDALDREMISAMAAHAGLALELAEVRRDNERLRLVEDRTQIAEDLRHRAVSRLFAHGLALQGAASRANRPEVREALEAQVDAVDAVIRDIRAAAFSLDPRPQESREGGTPA